MKLSAAASVAGLAAMLSAPPGASALEQVKIAIAGHRFAPAEITVPAGEKFRIEVTNTDPTPEEFESHDLKVEKIVAGGGTIGVLAGPLAPGRYKVFGDYHPDTATATVVAAKKD